jgi:hypothetical protein
METFGTISMSFAIIGFIFAISALVKITKLEKRLKEVGVLDREYKS